MILYTFSKQFIFKVFWRTLWWHHMLINFQRPSASSFRFVFSAYFYRHYFLLFSLLFFIFIQLLICLSLTRLFRWVFSKYFLVFARMCVRWKTLLDSPLFFFSYFQVFFHPLSLLFFSWSYSLLHLLLLLQLIFFRLICLFTVFILFFSIFSFFFSFFFSSTFLLDFQGKWANRQNSLFGRQHWVIKGTKQVCQLQLELERTI